jgi:hypothetical protein
MFTTMHVSNSSSIVISMNTSSMNTPYLVGYAKRQDGSFHPISSAVDDATTN